MIRSLPQQLRERNFRFNLTVLRQSYIDAFHRAFTCFLVCAISPNFQSDIGQKEEILNKRQNELDKQAEILDAQTLKLTESGIWKLKKQIPHSKISGIWTLRGVLLTPRYSYQPITTLDFWKNAS